MKKISLILIVLFQVFEAFGQKPDTSDWTALGRLKDGTVIVFDSHTNPTGKYIFFYKNGRKWDTLSFDLTDAYEIETCTLKAVQMDGKELKEIIVTWGYENYGSTGQGGFQFDETMNDIWNLDTRKKIFTARSNYHNFDNNSSWATDSAGEMTDIETTTEDCSYNYDFSVNDKGLIMIKNLKSNYSLETNSESTHNKSLTCKDALPDHKEDTYKMLKGQFILIEEK